jgi:hypothetical protein
MTGSLHPDATRHVPGFITAPGETDILLAVTALVVVGAVLGIGILFLRLHTLPERIAHRAQKVQIQVVAILGLLALFTHNHAFWVAGLVLALVDMPDFGTPLRQMASSLERIAGSVSDETTSGTRAKADVGSRTEAATSTIEGEAPSRRPKVRVEA